MLLFDKRLPAFAKNITLNVIIKNRQINTISLQKFYSVHTVQFRIIYKFNVFINSTVKWIVS